MSKGKLHPVWRKLMWPVFKLGITIYALLLGLLLLFQNKLIYMPSRQMDCTPEAWGMAYEDVYLTTEDGVRIHGWYIPCDGAQKSLLFFHGNAGNISHRQGSIAVFHQLGVNVLAIDYRGYGKSQGKPSEAGTYQDASAAWAYLVNEKGVSTEDIISHGRSLGGAIAVWLASERQVGSLIIESSFTSVPELAKDLYPFIPTEKLIKYKYNSREKLNSVSCPVLTVHSREDDIIPYKHGESLYEAAQEPKTFLDIEGDHNYGFAQSGDIYFSGLKAFMEKTLAVNNE
jgi:hypothetical protein